MRVRECSHLSENFVRVIRGDVCTRRRDRERACERRELVFERLRARAGHGCARCTRTHRECHAQRLQLYREPLEEHGHGRIIRVRATSRRAERRDARRRDGCRERGHVAKAAEHIPRAENRRADHARSRSGRRGGVNVRERENAVRQLREAAQSWAVSSSIGVGGGGEVSQGP